MSEAEIIHAIQTIDDEVAALLLLRASYTAMLQQDAPPEGVLPEAWADRRYRQWWHYQHGGR